MTVLVAALVLAPPAPRLSTKDLVGIWQRGEVLAAGWNDVYRFFPDGRFRFHGNQMDLTKRELERSGTWSLKGMTLELKVQKRIVLQGGRIIPNGGIEEAEPELVDARKITQTFSPPKRSTPKLSGLRRPQSGHMSVLIGGVRYWKHRNDPKDYE